MRPSCAHASASFFLGQQKVMPLWMHGSPVLTVLGTAPLGFLIFWLIRVRFTNAYIRHPVPSGGKVQSLST